MSDTRAAKARCLSLTFFKFQPFNAKEMIPTVNFHLIKACNFKCKFCYATFNDIRSKGISKAEQLKLIECLAESNLFKKINFAGGEPTLIPHLQELIKHAKNCGLTTSIVTNGSRIDMRWIERVAPYLDIIGLSIDSIDEKTNIESGRSQAQRVLKVEQAEKIATACKIFGVHLKINTVVSRYNQHETLSDFINTIQPFRWKILQVTKVEGQNDAQFDEVKISSEEFQNYCKRNRNGVLPEIKVIEECSDLIQGSYLMIDQLGRFYDDYNGKHNYSAKILEAGVEQALEEVWVDKHKFEERDGEYTLATIKL
jgi:radical S-adenosyl methionine domain-containing protein 2